MILLKKNKPDYHKIASLEREFFPELHPDYYKITLIPPGSIGCIWMGRVCKITGIDKNEIPITMIYGKTPEEIFAQLCLDKYNYVYKETLNRCIKNNTRLVDNKGKLRPNPERISPIVKGELKARYQATLCEQGKEIIGLKEISS